MSTITRSDIVDAVHSEIGLSRKDSGDILDMIISEIMEELIAGNDVKLSTFGTFSLHDKTARIGRNPKTGVSATIKPRRVISFKASQTLRNHINRRHA